MLLIVLLNSYNKGENRQRSYLPEVDYALKGLLLDPCGRLSLPSASLLTLEVFCLLEASGSMKTQYFIFSHKKKPGK